MTRVISVWKLVCGGGREIKRLCEWWRDFSLYRVKSTNSYIDKPLYQMLLMRSFLMMTSSNGNIFRVTGPLCGEFVGHRWIPLTKASDAELWFFIWAWINVWVNNREAGDLRRHRVHYDVTLMCLPHTSSANTIVVYANDIHVVYSITGTRWFNLHNVFDNSEYVISTKRE